jgi:hypothetical protein
MCVIGKVSSGTEIAEGADFMLKERRNGPSRDVPVIVLHIFTNGYSVKTRRARYTARV